MTDAHALRLQLLQAGYLVIPLFGKEPPIYGKNNPKKGLGGWQKITVVTPKMLDMWAKTWPDATNTGCLTRLTPTLDGDILDEAAANACKQFIRDRYEDAGYVLFRTGKPPKFAVPFRTNFDEVFKKYVVNLIAPDGSEGQKIELLADGEQVVVAGEHPDTKQPYRWSNGGLEQVKHEDLPYIREAEARALVDELVELLFRDFGYKRATARPKDKTNGAKAHDGGGGGDRDWQTLTQNILKGRELHDSITILAAKMIACGTNSGAVLNQLRALAEISEAPKDERWRLRVSDIPRAVDSAVAKYGKTARSSSEPKAEPAPEPTSEAPADNAAEPSHIWRSKNYDYPCTPTGKEDRAPDGRIFVEVRAPDGSQTFVPKDELVFKDDAKPETAPAPEAESEPEPKPEPKPKPKPKSAPAPSGTESPRLRATHNVFRKWLDKDYDINVLDAVLAAAAAERLGGDPLWLLVISGPGNAKTETVQSLVGAGAMITSTITSEGALLSATKKNAKGATGGLLCELGERGILVIKDVTSILAADRNARGLVLSAIREIYDGKWVRNVGNDGGRKLTWAGRIVVVGAVTTAWDTAHSVIATMGDRFVIIRADSSRGRTKSASRAIRNTGSEIQMRKELAQSAGALIKHIGKKEYVPSDDEIDQLIKAADIVTAARTGVERDYRGEVINAHALEMPTRFAKQLGQLVRGAVAIGIPAKNAMRLAIRCARDSIPPLRCEILLDIAAHPNSEPHEVHRRIERPRHTVRRELEALHMLRLLQCEETDEENDKGKIVKTIYQYSLGEDFDRDTLLAMTAPSALPEED